MRNLRCLGIFLIAVLLAACTTPPPEEPQIDPETQYLEEARAFLNSESEAQFWLTINTGSQDFPAATETLLSEYEDRQVVLAKHYQDAEDFVKAQFYADNLEALPLGLFDQDDRSLLIESIEAERRASLDELVEALKAQGEAYVLDDETTGPQDYRDSVARISIRYYWESTQGAERYNLESVNGTGFLLTPRHVLTAFHIVDAALDPFYHRFEINLGFGDQRIEDVKILAWDALTDLAILELPEALDRPFLMNQLAPSSELAQGDVIYALGHPEGFVNTLGQGIIAAESRSAPEWGEWMQVDALSAPGMSGGLIFDESGAIVGMMVAGMSWGAEINFAVPSDLILQVVDRLLAGESLRRPWLGVLLEDDLTIRGIFEESPLITAGVEPGDRLLAVNGIELDDLAQAQAVLDELSAGNLVSVSLESQGEQSTRYATLMRRPAEPYYNKLVRMDLIERVSTVARVELDPASQEIIKIAGSNGNIMLQSFTVASIDEESFLYSRAVRQGDRLGLVNDDFADRDYLLEVLHLPRGLSVGDLEDIGDMIFSIERGQYHENIL